ncbi:MAG: hypothetical protein AAF525_16875 [Pseudomonadota bacterium]
MFKSSLRWVALITGITVASAPHLVFAEDYVEWVGANSGVNWSAARMRAEGAGAAPSGAPASTARNMACRAAVLDAQRNLVESIHGVRVEGTTVVENMMVQSDVIKSSVSGLLRGATMVSRDLQEDGSCLVTMTAPMSGNFAKDIYGQVSGNESASLIQQDLARDAHSPHSPAQNASLLINPQLSDGMQQLIAVLAGGLELLIPVAKASNTPPWQDALDQVNQRVSGIEDLLQQFPMIQTSGDTPPSGLVIDARGSNFIPSMSPRIRRIRGAVVYPTRQHFDRRKSNGQLVSLFTRDLETARRHPVVGDRPLVLKGLRTWGDSRTEIVLGNESSQQLTDLVEKGFLTDTGVIIVL